MVGTEEDADTADELLPPEVDGEGRAPLAAEEGGLARGCMGETGCNATRTNKERRGTQSERQS